MLGTLLTCGADKEKPAGCRKGSAYLAALVGKDGVIAAGPQGITYPVYTSAGAVLALSQPRAEHRKARDAWLAYLRSAS